MQSIERAIIVLDGHDGAGKTTLAGLLAETLEGAHLRPFGGKVGSQMLYLAAKGDFTSLSGLARCAVDRMLACTKKSVIIFDRHWMTIFTLIPEKLWIDWLPLPPTTLCWAPLDTTIERLSHRREQTCGREHHRRYLHLYEELGRRYDCNLLRTDLNSIEDSVRLLTDWARPRVCRLTQSDS